jgi:molybdate transport system ATP-binding protein
MTGLTARLNLRRGNLQIDVTVAVAAGETAALLGPNGAGKTTIVNALAGLVPLDAGEVKVGETVWEDPARRIRLKPQQRSAGVMFQQLALFPDMTALDNVAFGPISRGTPAKTARGRAHEVMTELGIGELAHRRPLELSGGEAQRVALARALAVRPDLVLLDEPLSDLDVQSRAAGRRALVKALAGFPGATLIVTHDPIEAMALAPTLLVIEGGRPVQAGSREDLRARPRSPYVADLVGVNLLRGRATRERIELVDGGSLVAPGQLAGEVLVAVHPRSVTLHLHPPDGTARNVWEGRVAGVDFEGDRARVRVTGTPTVIAEVTVAAVTDLRLGVGTPVWVSVKATQISVYPA